MSKPQLILIGGGGHCKSCIEVIEAEGKYSIAGILDMPEKIGMHILGYEIIGTEELISSFPIHFYFLITIGQIKDAKKRSILYKLLKVAEKKMATVISPFATVSSRCIIGEGSIIMHGARVNADTVIGHNAIVNTNVNIEHDCKIGNFVHVSTGAILNGGCEVGDKVFIGSNSVVLNGINITSLTVIGAGSVVTKSIIEPGIYLGNPCTILRKQS